MPFNPWAFWKLNEAAGSATCADSSGHGRTLNVTAALVTLGARGQIPTSADTCAFCKFTNVAANLYLQTAAGQTWSQANTISIEAWLSPSSQGGAEKTVAVHGSISAPANFTWWLRLNNGVPLMATVNAGVQTNYTLGTTGILDNGVHQLVVVLDGTNVTAYVDSVQVGQVAQTANIGVPFTRIAYLNQGIGGAGARAWTGTLGPVVVYETPLTQANVNTLWAAATTLPS